MKTSAIEATARRGVRAERLERRVLLSGFETVTGALDVDRLLAAGRATVAAPAADVGRVQDVFDGDYASPYRATTRGPLAVELSFATPKTVDQFTVRFSDGPAATDYRWRVEASGGSQPAAPEWAEVVPWARTAANVNSTRRMVLPTDVQRLRLSAERVGSDEPVQLNEWNVQGDLLIQSISIAPPATTIMKFGEKHFSATATDSDGVAHDFTPMVKWFTSDHGAAIVDDTGLARALESGAETVIATLGGLFSEAALTVVEPAPWDLDVTYLERTPRYDYDAARSAPAPGDVVTFRGHVRNWDGFTPAAAYRWEVDGVAAGSGVLADLAANEERVVELQWAWQAGPHRVRLVVDPDDAVRELSESNNTVEDRTDGLAVGFWVEQSVYDQFHAGQRKLGNGANGFEDWAQRQLGRWNALNASSIWDVTPQGATDRVRLDKLVVVPDGWLAQNGGTAARPDPLDKTADVMHGFAWDPAGAYYADTMTRVPGNPFYLDASLLRSMAAQRSLADPSVFDVTNTPAAPQVQIVEPTTGLPVAGTPLMPYLADGQVLYRNQSGGAMGGPYGPSVWSPLEAGALQRVAGRRIVPDGVGGYLNDLPANNHLQIIDGAGNAMAGAEVRWYSASGGPGGKVFDDTPDFVLSTDVSGRVLLPRDPFAPGQIRQAIIRVSSSPDVWYRFFDATEMNLEYWRGHTVHAGYTIQLPSASAPAVMEVTGAGQLIQDGDVTPVAADLTDFGDGVVGPPRVGDAPLTRTFVVRNRGGQTLQLGDVFVSGVDAGAFTILQPPVRTLAPGTLTTFQVVFDSHASGVRNATVGIAQAASETDPSASAAGGVDRPTALNTGLNVELGGTLPPLTDDATSRAVGGTTYDARHFIDIVTVSEPGVTFMRCLFDRGVIIEAGGDNTLIKNSKIVGGQYGILCWSNARNLVFENVEIGGSVQPGAIVSKGIIGNNFTAIRCDVHHAGSDGVVSAGNNVTVSQCYIHDNGYGGYNAAKPTESDHTDGIQVFGGHNITITHNTVVTRHGGIRPDGSSTGFPERSQVAPWGTANSAIVLQSDDDSGGAIDNWTVSSNWLDGGIVTFRLEEKDGNEMTNGVVNGNQFGHDYYVGSFAEIGTPTYVSGANVYEAVDGGPANPFLFAVRANGGDQPPTAVLSDAPNVTAAGGTAYFFKVTYADDKAVDFRSIMAGNDIVVLGPHNFLQQATLANLPWSSDPRTWTATYYVAAPGGSWDFADAGTYTISLRPHEVSDTAGHYAAAALLGSFGASFPDSTPPVVVGTGLPDVTILNTPNYFFTVQYTDNVAVSYQSILAGNDVAVTGPNFFGQLGTLASLTFSAGVWTASYYVPAPGGGFDPLENGTYTVSLRANEVSDTTGNFAPPRTLGQFSVTVVDPKPPVATLGNAPTVSSPGAPNYFFTVLYTDNVAVKYQTILDGNDVAVTGPGGYSRLGTIASLTHSAGVWTASYYVPAPGGAFDPSDSGTYTISLRDNEVADTSGNFVPAKVLGNFSVAFPDATPPAATLEAHPDVTAPTTNAYFFRVTYTDATAVNFRSIMAGNDILVTGPNDYSQLATLANLPWSADPKTWTATYYVTAPGGAWDAADSGAYQIALRAGEVSDTVGNAAPGTVLGGFSVAIAPPPQQGIASTPTTDPALFSDTGITARRRRPAPRLVLEDGPANSVLPSPYD